MNTDNTRRVSGGASIAGGALILLFGLLVPGWLTDFVGRCNTRLGQYVGQQEAATGAKCAAANFIVDYRWIILILGGATVIGGLVALFGGDAEDSE